MSRARLTAAVGLLAALPGCGGSHSAGGPTTSSAAHTTPRHPPAPPRRVSAVRIGSLSAPLQDPAVAVVPAGRAVALGGLDATDVSTSAIRVVTGGTARDVGRLPQAVHDAGAAALGGSVYLFGGGNVSQSPAILRVDPVTGHTAPAGTLPAPASDVSVGVVGGTAYVVGGFDGARWLDTIVAWRPGGRARVVARLPVGLRYAAVAPWGHRLTIAGGTTPTGTSDAVLVFDPASGAVHRVARLPHPLSHAGAAALGSEVFVFGGRTSGPGTQTSQVLAIDAAAGRVRTAGRLPTPLSDMGVAAQPAGVELIGGRAPSGAIAALQLVRA